MAEIFKVNAKPPRWTIVVLPWILFVVLIVTYTITSESRHKENPKDKLMPTITKLVDGAKRSAFEEDRRSGEIRLWIDTWASFKRLFIAMVIICVGGVLIGLNMGTLPYAELVLYRFFIFFDKVPTLCLLPILFIVFGLDDTAKIALMVLGVMPTIVLDTYLRAKSYPKELIIKGMTLGASNLEMIYRIVFPKILPEVLDTIRLNLKSVILFLIAGEALAATCGLGYRIFLVRRYVAMDIIIPYVIWISLLAFLADFIISYSIKNGFAWRGVSK